MVNITKIYFVVNQRTTAQ